MLGHDRFRRKPLSRVEQPHPDGALELKRYLLGAAGDDLPLGPDLGCHFQGAEGHGTAVFPHFFRQMPGLLLVTNSTDNNKF
jgi:hypothetical protein